ncbi:hypothetical protein FOZ62_006112 [Perkinsus olseni]|uniref:Uncharacterized protein n=1 Tax=Perkinsus olseni TaxID=32597 RepID=A0A7J6R2D1_PEROL|nr:hypothetical protein FOZ62_006112 [Perkinsus olseni]
MFRLLTSEPSVTLCLQDLGYIISHADTGLAPALVRRIGDHNHRVSENARNLALKIVSLCGAEALLPYLSLLDASKMLKHSIEAAEESIVSRRGLSPNFMNARVKMGLDIMDMCKSDGSVQLDHIMPLAVAGLCHHSGEVRKNAIDLAAKCYEIFGDGFLKKYEEVWQARVPAHVNELVTARFMDIYDQLQDPAMDDD